MCPGQRISGLPPRPGPARRRPFISNRCAGRVDSDSGRTRSASYWPGISGSGNVTGTDTSRRPVGDFGVPMLSKSPWPRLRAA